ncbi:hypothetical protein CASFOL_009784 [Castilleja foliolosa]|uniref:TF-B3 domain-containing protein n=1 Tax=Castilleja foliolosa TaxID=1961234 RepID=A0ABD3DUP3_9LAMI
MKKDSKRSPNSYSDDKLKLRKVKKKKRLAAKLKMALTDKKIVEEPVNIVDKHIISYTPNNEKSTVMERALAIQNNLPPNSTSFVKNMLRSHVSGPFWLGLPRQFCVDHLPKRDERVVLVDENETEHDTKYLQVKKSGLSGGWRGFSIAHKLAEGDVLVFELIEPCKFKKIPDLNSRFRSLNKVHIVRASESENSLTIEENFQVEPSETEIAEITEKALLHFKDVKCFADFKIEVDGLILDPEMSRHVRKQYYKLCKSQKVFLHENLKGFNRVSAVRVISETVNIADTIWTAKPSTTILESYNGTLKGFEDSGMAVGFLRARIDELLGPSVMESKRNELNAEEEKMKVLKMKVNGVRVSTEKRVGEICCGLKEKHEKLSVVFSGIAGAPWALGEEK